jgi:PIN domain nuclease of toxin-antitoxin system
VGGRRLILLDTHALVWLDAGDERLGRRARRLIDQALAEDDLAVSAISFWEVAMLEAKGRLRLHQEPQSWRGDLLDRGLLELPVDGETGVRAARLADFHGDPADRLIVATALAGHRLVTADERILGWPGVLLTHDARR